MMNKATMILSATLIILLCFTTGLVASKELIVGGKEGWAVPKSKDEQQRLFFFNDWASSNRFQLNDTLRFKYEKDSVMVVAEEEEYDKCRSSHPVVYFNDGDTRFTLDRPGLFYFVSGVTGHCQRGLKMIVKVLDVDDNNGDGDAPSGQPDDGREEKSSSAASSVSYSIGAAAALLALPYLFF
ncbi:Early nodulin-like protein 1 [Linum grandiflorum]